MSFSKLFFFSFLSFVLGVGVASFFVFPKVIIWELFILSILSLIFCIKDKKILIFSLCLIFLSLGILRMEAVGYISEAKVFSMYEKGPVSEIVEPIKKKIRVKIYENFPPPQSELIGAIMLGDKSEISDKTKEKLNFAGVRHLVAISGLHIVIISGIIIWIFIVLGLSRPKAFYPTLFLLWFFIFFTGFQPSAVRAGIMGSLFLYSEKIGRERSGKNALLLAATIMLLINPMLLRYNVGFQLSFLATIGLMYFMPIFRKALYKVKILNAFDVSYLLAVTFSAQVLTLPILIYNFGYFSLISPVSNIIIVPLLSYVMVLGFLFLLFSFIVPFISFIFYLPLYLLISFIIISVDFFAGLPFSYINFSISFWWIAALYLAGIVLFILFRRGVFENFHNSL